jgi:hypothetical protein
MQPNHATLMRAVPNPHTRTCSRGHHASGFYSKGLILLVVLRIRLAKYLELGTVALGSNNEQPCVFVSVSDYRFVVTQLPHDGGSHETVQQDVHTSAMVITQSTCQRDGCGQSSSCPGCKVGGLLL